MVLSVFLISTILKSLHIGIKDDQSIGPVTTGFRLFLSITYNSPDLKAITKSLDIELRKNSNRASLCVEIGQTDAEISRFTFLKDGCYPLLGYVGRILGRPIQSI